jgi:hypothetical protein
MARYERTPHVDSFAHEGDFNEQLYHALRQSPWYIISLVLHVLVLVGLSLLPTDDKAPPPDPQAQINMAAEKLEEEVPETPEETKEVRPDEVVSKEPVIKDTEIAEKVETDNDLPFEESLGDEGLSDAPFRGPANNSSIGVGGGGGGAFGGRGGNRDTSGGGGGRKRTNDAVEHALRWLMAHQSPDGGWEAAGFDKWCDGKPAEEGKRPEGLGKVPYDPGVTGLALCAFLGAGYTNRGNHEFAGTVSKGLRYLKNIQDPEGCFGPRANQHYIYNHATAALAMVEAYGMTESPVFRGPAQKALDFIALARNPYLAWRYGVKPGNDDMSVTGWMMMALKSAKLINDDAKARGKETPLLIDEEAFDGIKAWVEKMTDPDSGRAGYMERGGGPARPHELIDRFPANKSESMTAAAVLARIFIGEDPRKSEMVKKGAALMAALPPKWAPEEGTIDMYYWYYATLAMYQVGGQQWEKWNSALQSDVVDKQRLDGEYCLYKGSWDPIDPWGSDGGRVYSTAVLAMCLEVYYRYDKVFGTK